LHPHPLLGGEAAVALRADFSNELTGWSHKRPAEINPILVGRRPDRQRPLCRWVRGFMIQLKMYRRGVQ